MRISKVGVLMFGSSLTTFETKCADWAMKGYDVVYVDDISATTSPEAAYGMVRYNADLNGKSVILE